MPLLPLLALFVAAAPGAVHPNSLSVSRVVVRGALVTVQVRCQMQSVCEIMGAEADRDSNRLLSAEELDVVRADFSAYLLANFRLSVGSGGAWSRGTPLVGRLTELRPGDIEADLSGEQQWIEATLLFDHDAPVPDLLVGDTLFQDVSPEHFDVCELHFNDEPLVEARFWQGETERYYTPAMSPRVVPLLDWVGMGVRHILSGWDHLAFLLGLLVAAGSLLSVLGVITAFTLAHSVTLALAALGLVTVPGRPVEVLIAASIAYVGMANLLQRRPVARWKEAFGFGLVHGLGFAGFLAEALAGEPRRLVPLVGFNLGVEAGQFTVVLGVTLVLSLLRLVRRPGDGSADAGGERWLAPRPVRLAASIGVVLVGLYWVVERALPS